MSNENFSYYDDVSLEIKGKSYTVGELIQMNDTDFNTHYKNYESDIKTQIDENATSRGYQFGMLAISHTISLMEKIRLERHIKKLESKLEIVHTNTYV